MEKRNLVDEYDEYRESYQVDSRLEFTEEYIVFKIESKNYGINIKHIKKILKKCDILEVHGFPDYILGLINVSGEIFPLFDLKNKFSLENSGKYGKFSVIVVLNFQGEELALITDSVVDIYNVSLNDLKPASLNKREGNFVPCEAIFLDLNIKILSLAEIFKLKNLY